MAFAAPSPIVNTAAAQAYVAKRRALFQRRMVIASKLALVLVPLFGVTDYFAYPNALVPLLGARLVSFVASVAIFLMVRRPFGRRYAPLFGILLSIEIALAIAVVPVYINGVDTPHYVSMALLILALAALMPWTSVQVEIYSVVLTVMFVAGALAGGHLSNVMAFAMQVSAIIVTGVIAAVISALGESMRRSEFGARYDLRAASREKTRLIADLQQKTEELQSLNQEMEDLLYVSSHDLRAPLINVQGFANELQIGFDKLQPYISEAPEAAAINVDVEESLHFIQTAVARMDALINGLLNVSRVATRTSPTEDVPLHSTVEKIVESFRYQLEQQRIIVHVEPLPTVRGDAVRLGQVFSNLVDNAIKYMGESPRREIEIGMRNGHGLPIFFVRDTGPGIPANSQETVFRLFRRLATKVSGDGLGLTLVRKIIEKHGGRIWIESTPGQGSTFCFTLAAVSRARMEPGQRASLAADSSPSPDPVPLPSPRGNGRAHPLLTGVAALAKTTGNSY